jgi:hypothetical protein
VPHRYDRKGIPEPQPILRDALRIYPELLRRSLFVEQNSGTATMFRIES